MDVGFLSGYGSIEQPKGPGVSSFFHRHRTPARRDGAKFPIFPFLPLDGSGILIIHISS
jgi:hypothetical protein